MKWYKGITRLGLGSGRPKPDTAKPQDLRVEQVVCGGLTWLNLEKPTRREVDYLAESYGFHPLDLDDCREARMKLSWFLGLLGSQAAVTRLGRSRQRSTTHTRVITTPE